MINCILSNTTDLVKQATPGREEAVACLEEPAVVEQNATDLVAGYQDPCLGWNSHQVQSLVWSETAKWVYGLAKWKSFVTLTFKEEKTPDVAAALWRWFVRQNNEHVFGKHYTRAVGHSYFSYVVGMEYQVRDVVHFHALVDQPIDYEFVHRTWGERCGFAWIDGNIKSMAAAVAYVCKYCVKRGQIDAYVAKKRSIPAVLPDWWHDEVPISSRIVQGALSFDLNDLLKVLDDEGRLKIS